MNELCFGHPLRIPASWIWQFGGFLVFFTHTVPLQSELVHLVEPGHCQPTQRGGVHSDNAVIFHDINRFIGVTCW